MEKVRLGARTRDAIPVPANSSFEIALPPGSARLVFSIGARGIEAADGLRFVVSARTPASVCERGRE
jgi:hypothetical protein